MRSRRLARARHPRARDNSPRPSASFYSPEHAQLRATSSRRIAKAAARSFPLLTLSVAALDSETLGATSADAIAHLLAHVKKIAKQQPGNSFVLRSGERVVDLMQRQRAPPRTPS